MSRSGLEAKPAWRLVPPNVRQALQDALGTSATHGRRVWGGYGPTPTFRLTLADGRRVFFKGTDRTSNAFSRDALVREERVYRGLSAVIGPWAPQFYGAFRCDDWHVLLLEDVGPKTVPPWTAATTQRVAREYATYHASTLGQGDLPLWLPRPQASLGRVTWARVAAESDHLQRVAALAGDHNTEALVWLSAALPSLRHLADSAADQPGPYALLHGDTRSDNLRFVRGRLALFDWPSAEVGRPEFDVVAFAQSVTVDGGALPERIVDWYSERLALRQETLDVAIAWLAAFFADLAWRPVIPGLPRLRPFQRQQLAVMLAWAARRLHLPDPIWVAAMQ